MDKQVAFLLLHPVIVPVTSFNLFRLHLIVFVQAIKSLLLKVNLGLRSRITNLLVLFHFELIQLGVLGDRS